MMRTWSHRQYKAAQAWLATELNRPNRSDHYAMQVAWAVCAANGGKETTLEPFKIKFERARRDDEIISEEEFQRIVSSQKAMILSGLGGKVEHRVISRKEAGLD